MFKLNDANLYENPDLIDFTEILMEIGETAVSVTGIQIIF